MKLKGSMLDADGHLIERDEDLYEYLDPPYAGTEAMLGFPFFPTLDGYHRGALTARLKIHKKYVITAQVWLDFLDATGIESTVLYPTNGLAFHTVQDPAWAVALARAYNNWFTDRFHRVSTRLQAMALVPVQNMPEAVKELRRAVTELGMVGAVLSANSGDVGVRKPLGHPDFWPLYEEAERLDVPIALHGAPSTNIGINFFTQFAETHALEHPIAQTIQLTSMVMGGVFERFPRLRVAYLEAGAGWVPYIMDRLDRSYEIWATAEYKEFSEWLRRKPSEYIRSGQIYFSCEAGEITLPYAIQRVGHQALLFASDFPHETNIERAQHEIKELLEHPALSDEAKQGIFRDNIARFYGSRLRT
ncbi:MAG: amidohydrolase [Betaproteobacteria bacterium]|nr:amidohydrolase [Betaproteobacteria bacterium]